MKDNAVYESIKELDIPNNSDSGVIKDEIVSVETVDDEGKAVHLKLRRVVYWDEQNKKVLVFQCNHLELEAELIALIYKRRWHIEQLFKKLKQNFPLKYFLGDNQNAIEIQIWVALIAMLLLQVVQNGIKKSWAFSNLVSLVSFHLMSYINIINFLNNPEKCWTEKQKALSKPSLFNTSWGLLLKWKTKNQ